MKWLGFSLVFLLVAFAISKEHSFKPNQELFLSPSNVYQTSKGQDDVIAQIQEKLTSLGVTDLIIEYSNNGEVSIRYYSAYQPDFIQSHLEEEFHVTVDTISNPSSTNSGFDGVIVVERKNEVNRNLDISLSAFLKPTKANSENVQLNCKKELSGFSQKAYSNTEHNTANVRAGPVA